MTDPPVPEDALDRLTEHIGEWPQYWCGFISAQAWRARGCDPRSLPAILHPSVSSFWFRIELARSGALVVVAWHDFSPIDRTIELSVGLLRVSWAQVLPVLADHLPEQCDHVDRVLGLRRVVSRVDAAAGSPHTALRLDGVVPRLVTDGRGNTRDIAHLSAYVPELVGAERVAPREDADRGVTGVQT